MLKIVLQDSLLRYLEAMFELLKHVKSHHLFEFRPPKKSTDNDQILSFSFFARQADASCLALLRPCDVKKC